MKLFGKSEKKQITIQKSGKNHLGEGQTPATFPSECLGEKCPNFKGTACKSSFFEWIGAKATVNEGRDLTQPPRQNEAIYVTYGQICVEGAGYKGLRYRIHDYGKEHFYHDETGLIMHGDSAFGEGIDVDLFDIKISDDGSMVEQLRQTFDGWAPGGLREMGQR